VAVGCIAVTLGGTGPSLCPSRRPAASSHSFGGTHRLDSVHSIRNARHSSESWNLSSFQRIEEVRFQLALE